MPEQVCFRVAAGLAWVATVQVPPSHCKKELHTRIKQKGLPMQCGSNKRVGGMSCRAGWEAAVPSSCELDLVSRA